MKILVAIKRVADPNFTIHISSDQKRVELSDAKMFLNPYCEIALEEAIRYKEAGIASEIVAVSIGGIACQEQLRTALALGVDRAIHVDAEDNLEPLIVAKLLAKVCILEQPQLILMGKQAIDNDNNQTGQMLAGLLGISQGCAVSKVMFESQYILVTQEVDIGQQMMRLQLPALLTVDLSLNKPRHASLPNVIKSKRKPIETLGYDKLAVDTSARTFCIEVKLLSGQRGGVKVESVNELIHKLRNEARVI